MSSPLANVPSKLLATESPSTPTSYVSLLDSSQSSGTSIGFSLYLNKNEFDWLDALAPSAAHCSTYKWIQSFDTVRQWSTRTLKFTRQLFQEQLGQCNKTQDLELEKNIEVCV